MPRIPLYQQDKLASSLVGTPGVDPSGSMLASSIEGITGQAASFGLQAQAQQNQMARQQQAMFARQGAAALSDFNREMQVRQAAQRAVEKQQQQIQNETDTANNSAAFKQKLTDLESKLMADNANTPELVPKLYQTQAQALLNDHNKGITNEDVKANVNRVGMSEISQGYETMVKHYVPKQRDEVLSNELAQNRSNYVQASGNGGDLKAFAQGVIAHDEKLMPAYKNKFGVAAGVEMDKTHEAMANEFLNSMMYTQPTQAKEWLEKGLFDKYMDKTTKDTRITEAITHEEKLKKIAADKLQLDNHSTYQRVTDIWGSINHFAPDESQSAAAVTELNKILTVEYKKPAKLRDDALVKEILDKRNSIENTQRTAIRDDRMFQNSLRALTLQERTDAAYRRSEEQRQKMDVARNRAIQPDALELTGSAQKAYQLAVDPNVNVSPMDRLNRINTARGLIDDIHTKKLDALPGQDKYYANQRDQLNAQLIKVSHTLDEMQKAKTAPQAAKDKANEPWQWPQWLGGPAPKPVDPQVLAKQKISDILVQQAPSSVMHPLNPYGDQAKKLQIDMYYVSIFDKGVQKYRMEHNGNYPDDASLMKIARGTEEITLQRWKPLPGAK